MRGPVTLQGFLHTLAVTGNPPRFPLIPRSWQGSCEYGSSEVRSSPSHPASWLTVVQDFTSSPPTWVMAEAAEGTQLPPAHLGPAGFGPPRDPWVPWTYLPSYRETGEGGYAGFQKGRQTSLHLLSPHQGKQLLEILLKEPQGGRDPGKSAAE